MHRSAVALLICLAWVTSCSPAGGSTSLPSSTSPSFEVQLVGDGVVALTYSDVAGRPRRVLAELREPRPGDAPAPVVVWSHGGSSGKRSTTRVGVAWGQAFTERGFAFVAVAHPGRSRAERTALCDALEVVDCSRFTYLDWDRPADVAVVLDWLTSHSRPTLDMSKLVYGGHSAGARAVLRLAGADLPVPGSRQVGRDPRFVAFIVASPPGAAAAGITARSLSGLDRPLLALSGAGDTTNGNAAADRRTTIEWMPPGSTVGIWVDDPHARHTTFDLNVVSCERAGGTPDRCREIVRGLGTAATRFLQNVLEGGSVDGFELDAASRLPDAFGIVR